MFLAFFLPNIFYSPPTIYPFLFLSILNHFQPPTLFSPLLDFSAPVHISHGFGFVLCSLSLFVLHLKETNYAQPITSETATKQNIASIKTLKNVDNAMIYISIITLILTIVLQKLFIGNLPAQMFIS